MMHFFRQLTALALADDGWEEDGDRLTLNYEEYSSLTGKPYEDREYQLTVQLMEDGRFRYLSNHRA